MCLLARVTCPTLTSSPWSSLSKRKRNTSQSLQPCPVWATWAAFWGRFSKTFFLCSFATTLLCDVFWSETLRGWCLLSSHAFSQLRIFQTKPPKLKPARQNSCSPTTRVYWSPARVEIYYPLCTRRLLSRPPRPALFSPRTLPPTPLTVCVWKTTKISYATRFIASGNLFSGRFQNQQKFCKKHCRVKLWNLSVKLERFFRSFKSTVEKEYAIHWQTPEIYSFAVHDVPVHTKQSFINKVGCHHAERISCKIIESWKLQSVVCPVHIAAPLYRELCVALNFLLMSLSHALGKHSVSCTKNVLSRALPTRIAPQFCGGDQPLRARRKRPHLCFSTFCCSGTFRKCLLCSWNAMQWSKCPSYFL